MNIKKIIRAQRSPIWEDMNPPALRKLALAVALIFAVIGPIQVLMLPMLPVDLWPRIFALTLLSGGFAASIILFGRRLLFLLITIAVFLAVILALPTSYSIFLGKQQQQNDAVATEATVLSKEEIAKQGDLRLLIGMVGIMMLAAGYSVFIFVINKEVRRRAVLESEIIIAQNIQRSLLPAAPLRLPWCEIAGICVPAAEVGGDYFDVIKLSEQEVLIVIGDVSGHGLGAGILAAMTKSALYAQFEPVISPQRILSRLNHTLCHLTNKSSFVTFACVQINHAAQRATLATAGHLPILHYQKGSGEIAACRTPSLGLGINKEAAFEEIKRSFAPGDRFLLFTDGVIEASKGAAEQFGEQRLHETFRSQTHASANEASAAIITAVRDFSGQGILEDDATIVYVQIG